VGAPFILLAIVFTIPINLCAQKKEKLLIKRTTPIIKAAERFKPRPKFVEFEFEVFNKFRVHSTSDLLGNGSSTISQNLIRQVKVKFPIILKKDINLIGGLGFRHEQFKFKDLSEPGYPLYTAFEDKPLKRIASSFYFKKNLSDKRFLFIFLNNSLNSDRPNLFALGDQLKSSVAFIYGKQAHPNKQLGYGVNFGYDLGQPSILPLFIYNNDFTLHWGLELLLPKQVKLRYSPSNKMHYYGTIELQGASYHIEERLIETIDKLEFRRASVRFNFRAEREVHDWLWVGVTFGYRMPISIFLSEPGERRNNSLVKIDASNALYTNVSIFLVPPAKLIKRAKGS
jgi:hypothetical protein